jgi:hypothetical protein
MKFDQDGWYFLIRSLKRNLINHSIQEECNYRNSLEKMYCTYIKTLRLPRTVEHPGKIEEDIDIESDNDRKLVGELLNDFRSSMNETISGKFRDYYNQGLKDYFWPRIPSTVSGKEIRLAHLELYLDWNNGEILKGFLHKKELLQYLFRQSKNDQVARNTIIVFELQQAGEECLPINIDMDTKLINTQDRCNFLLRLHQWKKIIPLTTSEINKKLIKNVMESTPGKEVVDQLDRRLNEIYRNLHDYQRSEFMQFKEEQVFGSSVKSSHYTMQEYKTDLKNYINTILTWRPKDVIHRRIRIEYTIQFTYDGKHKRKQHQEDNKQGLKFDQDRIKQVLLNQGSHARSTLCVLVREGIG